MDELNQLLELANSGNVKAQFQLGGIYEYGEKVKQDYTKAKYWYTLAAEQGYAAAQYNLGHMYEHGLGVPQDYAEAAKWYTLAAKQGDKDAQRKIHNIAQKKNMKYLDNCYNFLQDIATAANKINNDWYIIHTPFVSLFNDTIDIYVKKEDDQILISDDSIIIDNLKHENPTIFDSPLSQSILNNILSRYDLTLKDTEIIGKTTTELFNKKIIDFFSALFEINNIKKLCNFCKGVL